MSSHGVLGGLADRPKLYQTRQDPASYGKKPWLPESSGGEPKSVMIAFKMDAAHTGVDAHAVTTVHTSI